MTMPRLATLSLLLSLTSCDASAPPQDVGAGDGGATDADEARDVATVDAGTDASLPATAVTLTYRGHTETIPRALFGYERADGVITEVYLELSRGGDDGCPSASSATPDQILTVSGYAGTDVGEQDAGITTAFFDFEGSFREEIAPASSTATRLELVVLDQAAGIASGSIDITFDEGTAIGAFTAMHCDSLDTDASE